MFFAKAMQQAGARGQRARIAALIALTALGFAVVACADIGRVTAVNPAPVNPESPVAKAVDAAARATYPTPSFASVPPVPTDVRSPAAYRAEVADVVTQRRDMAAWLRSHPHENTDTEAFAASARGEIPARESTPADAGREAEARVFADKLRAAARAPGKAPKTPH